MKTWAESKQMPGQFTGSTGAKVLSPAELTSGYQAWARKVTVLFTSQFILLFVFYIYLIMKICFKQLLYYYRNS